jgi:hypothetical protein
MPLLGNGEYREPFLLDEILQEPRDGSSPMIQARKQSQHSVTARIAMNNFSVPSTDSIQIPEGGHLVKKEQDPKSSASHSHSGESTLAAPSSGVRHGLSYGAALTDTPMTTAPNSPNM